MKTKPASRWRWIGGAALMLAGPVVGGGLAMALSFYLPWGVRLEGGPWIHPEHLSWTAVACGVLVAMVGAALLPTRRFARAVIAILWLSALVVLMPVGSWLVTCQVLRWCEPLPLTAEGLPMNPLELPRP